MSLTQVAFLRGINVGRAKRVAMADLRAAVTALGYRNVRTLLNSGNVVFQAPDSLGRDAARRIQDALRARVGIDARVITFTQSELASIIAANPLVATARDPSRLLVALLADQAQGALLEPLQRRDWSPEALATEARAAYLWCPAGGLESPLAKAVGRALGESVTTRNWATLTKLHVLAGQ